MECRKIPEDLSSVLKDLFYLGLIKPNCKLNLKTKTFCDNTSWFDYLWRITSGESRDHTIVFIDQVVNRAIEAVNSYSNHPRFLELLKEAIDKARHGLGNLATTYNQPSMVGELSIRITNLNLLIDEINKNLRSSEKTK